MKKAVISNSVIPGIEYDLNNIQFAFQPIFDIRTGDVFGFEALMRPIWCTPLELIRYSENAGLLDKIEEATFYYGTKAFLDAKLDGYLFLNSIPGVSMSTEVALATAEVGGYKMANKFYIEILEYTKYNKEVWDRKNSIMTQTGASPKIAIDDFGTGENIDACCIETYKPDLVKIDRKYISHIDINQENQIIVKGIITAMHKRGIEVLAEGVESKEEFLYLMHTGVDYMQGFYLGQPLTYT